MQTTNDLFTIEARRTVVSDEERNRWPAVCYGILFDVPLFGETVENAPETAVMLLKTIPHE